MTRIQYIPNRVIDINGISDGASLFVYQTGTTTTVPLFYDEGLTVAAPNPMIVPAGAEVPPFFTSYTGDIRLRVVEFGGMVAMDEDPYEQPLNRSTPVVDGRTIQQQFDYEQAQRPGSPQDQGAAGNGSTLDDVPFAAALTQTGELQINGNYALAQTKDVNYRQSMIGMARAGARANITVPVPSSYTNNTMFRANANAAETSWITPFPNLPTTEFKNFAISADAARAAGVRVRAFTFAGSNTFENIGAGGLATFAKQVPNLYCDKITFRKIHVEQPVDQTGGEYMFDCVGLGDGFVADQIDVTPGLGADGNNRMVNCFNLTGRSGGYMFNIINGINRLANNRGMSLAGWHIEHGYVISQDNCLSLRDSVLWQRQNTTAYPGFKRVPIQITTSSNILNAGYVELSNIMIAMWPNFFGGYASDIADISIASTARVSVPFKHVVRWVASDTGAVSDTTLVGARVADENGNFHPAFTAYAHVASTNSEMINNRLHMHTSLPAIATTNGITTVATSGKRTWAGASGTLYVKAAVYQDLPRRVGFIGASELSVAVTNGGSGVRIQVALPGANVRTMVRLYFGMPGVGGTASYNAYVDVPMVNGIQLYFDGNDVAGFPIVARTAGPEDAVNSYLLGGITWNAGDNGSGPYGSAIMRTTSQLGLVPTVGTFAAGFDEIHGQNAIIKYHTNGEWRIIGGSIYTNTNIGDADFNLTTASGQTLARYAEYVIGLTSPLTVGRTLTLPRASALPGGKVTVARSSASTGQNLIVYEDGVGTVATLGVGPQTYVLISNGTAWQAVRTV